MDRSAALPVAAGARTGHPASCMRASRAPPRRGLRRSHAQTLDTPRFAAEPAAVDARSNRPTRSRRVLACGIPRGYSAVPQMRVGHAPGYTDSARESAELQANV